jgi:hypothetical protein
LLRAWKTEEQELHAPVPLRYEIASALAQALSAVQLKSDAVADAIILHQPKDTTAVVTMAQQLERRSAYDAAYLVLAEELDTS